MTMDKIYINIGNIEKRSLEQDSDSRLVEGYAMLFDTESDHLNFTEKIDRGAITQELVDQCDVFAKLNHDDDKILARSNMGKGSLKLTVDDKGLYYSFTAPNTDLGNTLLEHIKRGEIYQSSFCFAIDNNDKTSQTWSRSQGNTTRQIHKIAYLFDIAPVYQPAYSQTTCDKRSVEQAEQYNKLCDKYNELILDLEQYMIP